MSSTRCRPTAGGGMPVAALVTRLWIPGLVCRIGFGFAAAAAAGQTAPLAEFVAREHVGVDWPLTLVNYEVAFPPGAAWPDRMRLVDDGGAEHPFQCSRVERHGDGSIAGATVSFRAGLPANGGYAYRLLPEAPAPAADRPSAALTGEGLILDNGWVAVRLPRPGRTAHQPPLAFGSDHAAMVARYGSDDGEPAALGPVRGIRLADGRWTGGSHFWAREPAAAPAILETVCELTEQGPLFVEASIRYAFDQDRFYRCTVRVVAGDPAVRMDEQFDMGAPGDPRAWQVVFALSGAWRPDHALWWKTTRWSTLATESSDVPQRLGRLGVQHAGNQLGVVALSEGKALGIEAWTPWGAYAGYCALVSSEDLPAVAGDAAEEPAPDAAAIGAPPAAPDVASTPFLALVPLHAGSWRGDGPHQNNTLVAHGGGLVAMHWPLQVGPFPSEMTHTGEFDPALPYSYGRRLWALVGGPLPTGYRSLGRLRHYEGYINLDDYKDWVLDWPEDPGLTYPRLLMSRDDVETIKARLDRHPLSDRVSPLLYFSDDPERQAALWKRITGPYDYSGPSGFTREVALRGYWQSFHKASMVSGWIGSADELLSSETLAPGQRQRLRRDLAILASALAEPDANPRGSMAHLGNPNMPMCRFFGLPLVAALLPDHPHYRQWMDVSAAYVRYLNARNTAPGGAWSELITYHGAGAPWLARGAAVLARAGFLEDAAARQAALSYRFLVGSLSPEDPRFGARMLSAWGHEGTSASASGWLAAAVAARRADPELARTILWGWDGMRRHYSDDFDQRAVVLAGPLGDPPGGQVPSALESGWLPGFGVNLRAHAGDPLETFLSYRQGYFISHSDDNQGDFVLWSKGAPLVPMTLVSYPLHQHEPYKQLHREFGWHSQLRVGAQSNNLGRWNPSSGVHAHAFGSSADYLRGAINYSGTEWWTRQILFLKGRSAGGPNYFVFRDGAHEPAGAQMPKPRWWQIRFWGGAEQVAPETDGLNYTSPFGPGLTVRFLQPTGTPPAALRQASRTDWFWPPASKNWVDAGSPTVEVDRNAGVKATETLTVASVGPWHQEQDIVTLLYPRREDEAPPSHEVLADGVVKLTTDEGVDYVFLGRRPLTFRRGDIAFSGIAGAVRLYPEEVHLIVSEGPAEVSYRDVTLKSDGPAAQVLPVEGWERRTIAMPAGEPAVAFVLDDREGDVEALQPGVRKQVLKEGVAYSFDAAEPIRFARDGVLFTGRQGGIRVDESVGMVRLVMLDGEEIGFREARAWGCDGPYEVVYHADRVTGRHGGLGRFLQVVKPAGLDRIPELVLDGGQGWAPGTHRDTVIIPLMPGEHRFELRSLSQPPVFRKPRLWQ